MQPCIPQGHSLSQEYIIHNLHKGDDDDDDDDDDMRYCKCDQTQIFHYLPKGEIKNAYLIYII